MTPLPGITLLVEDGALGVSQASPESVHVKIGISTAGTVNQLYTFTSDKQVTGTLGSGPLADAVAYALDVAGGPVLAIRANASTAGSYSAVTASNTGGTKTSTGTMTVANATGSTTPNDAYSVQISIVTAGTLGAAAFTYSLDGGNTFSPTIAVPSGGTYTIPGTGFTLTFTPGAGPNYFAVGDQFAFTTVAPSWTLTDLTNALNVLFASPTLWSFIHVVGTATATIAAGVDVLMTSAQNQNEFGFCLLEARDISSTTDTGSEQTWITNLSTTEWGSFASASERVGAFAGFCQLTSSLTGQVNRRSGAWTLAARLAKVKPQEHAGRVATGSIPGVTAIYHDEAALPGLDAAGFCTFRTHRGRAGFYFTAGRLMVAPGSDYTYIENRRVMDKASLYARQALMKYENAEVRVSAATGTILEQEAQQIENYVKGIVDSNVTSQGNCSATTARLNRTDNILSTRATTLTLRVLPKGYLSYLTLDVGFNNPKLALS